VHPWNWVTEQIKIDAEFVRGGSSCERPLVTSGPFFYSNRVKNGARWTSEPNPIDTSHNRVAFLRLLYYNQPRTVTLRQKEQDLSIPRPHMHPFQESWWIKVDYSSPGYRTYFLLLASPVTGALNKIGRIRPPSQTSNLYQLCVADYPGSLFLRRSPFRPSLTVPSPSAIPRPIGDITFSEDGAVRRDEKERKTPVDEWDIATLALSPSHTCQKVFQTTRVQTPQG